MEYCLYTRSHSSGFEWFKEADFENEKFFNWWNKCPERGIKEVYVSATELPKIIYVDSRHHNFDFKAWHEWQNQLPCGSDVIEFWIGECGKSPNDTKSASDIQIGGDHYKNFAIQPIDFIFKNKLGFIEGNIIKYISRYKDKNGLEDLKKIHHYVDLLIEREYPGEK